MLGALRANATSVDNTGMATIHITRSHQLGKTAARDIAEKIADQLKQELQATYQWNADSLDFTCPGASGSIKVAEQTVEVLVDLSFLLRPLKGKIEREVNQQLDQLLG